MINGNSNEQGENGMTTFTINADNAIVAFASTDDAEKSIGEGAEPFRSQKQLKELTAKWPISRFVETWNAMAGAVPFDDLRPVRKFENRAKAVARIWQAAQRLAPVAHPGAQDAPGAATATGGTKGKPNARGARKGGKDAPKAANASKTTKAKPGAQVTRDGSKKVVVMGMLAKGATLSELMAATDWQAHSVRGFLSTAAKKQGLTIESTRNKAGDRFYKIAK